MIDPGTFSVAVWYYGSHTLIWLAPKRPASIACFWLLGVPLGYLLAVPLNLGLAGVCGAIAIIEPLLAVLSIVIFRKGTWKNIAV